MFDYPFDHTTNYGMRADRLTVALVLFYLALLAAAIGYAWALAPTPAPTPKPAAPSSGVRSVSIRAERIGALRGASHVAPFLFVLAIPFCLDKRIYKRGRHMKDNTPNTPELGSLLAALLHDSGNDIDSAYTGGPREFTIVQGVQGRLQDKHPTGKLHDVEWLLGKEINWAGLPITYNTVQAFRDFADALEAAIVAFDGEGTGTGPGDEDEDDKARMAAEGGLGG